MKISYPVRMLFILFLGYGCSTQDDAPTAPTPKDSFTGVAPFAPEAVAVDNATSTSLRVLWRQTATADSYFVFYDSSPNGLFDLLCGQTADTVFTHRTLTSSSTYYYKVRAKNSFGVSAYSAVVSGVTLASPPPVPPDTTPVTPTGLTTKNPTTSSVTIEWNMTPTATHYQLYFSTSSDLLSPQLIYDGPANSFTHSSLLSCVTVYYSIRAINIVGPSSYSVPVPGSTLPLPPTALWVGNATPDRLVAVWTNADRVKLYQVQRSMNQNFSAATTAETIGPPYIDTGLASKTTYYYRARSVNSAGVSVWSNVGSGKTL